MKYKVSQNALERVKMRWGLEASEQLKGKVYYSLHDSDSLSQCLGITADDLTLTFDPYGWNPFPDLLPGEDPDKCYLLTDAKRRLYLGQWINSQWQIMYSSDTPEVIAFYACPRTYVPQQLDKHPDAIAARRYMAS